MCIQIHGCIRMCGYVCAYMYLGTSVCMYSGTRVLEYVCVVGTSVWVYSDTCVY